MNRLWIYSIAIVILYLLPVSLSGGLCDAPRFAFELIKFCQSGMDAAGPWCCASVLLTVDAYTYCWPHSVTSVEMLQDVWGAPSISPEDGDNCEPGSASPPKLGAPSAWPLRLWAAVRLDYAAAVATSVFVALKLWLPPSSARYSLGTSQKEASYHRL